MCIKIRIYVPSDMVSTQCIMVALEFEQNELTTVGHVFFANTSHKVHFQKKYILEIKYLSTIKI